MLTPGTDSGLVPVCRSWAFQGGCMTKADLVEKVTGTIARTAGPMISKKDCARVVDAFLEAVKEALAEAAQYRDSWLWYVQDPASQTRMARNPRTGDR